MTEEQDVESNKQHERTPHRMAPEVASVDSEFRNRFGGLPCNDDEHQAEYDDFLEYLNERFCGFTGS